MAQEIEVLSCVKCHSDVLKSQDACHRCGAKQAEFDKKNFWIGKEKGQ